MQIVILLFIKSFATAATVNTRVNRGWCFKLQKGMLFLRNGEQNKWIWLANSYCCCLQGTCYCLAGAKSIVQLVSYSCNRSHALSRGFLVANARRNNLGLLKHVAYGDRNVRRGSD